jgi:dGTPase
VLYRDRDFAREFEEGAGAANWRQPFARDYGRVIHSASFRRLQGKTQVFPGHESDFFRNRLTHSLEVAQIAEGIAERLNYVDANLKDLPREQQIDQRLCATASLLHDLGHPPFGHNGERALDDLMRQHGGFEGNAQTLRIIARLEKKVKGSDGSPLGLGLTFRTLAAVLKYDEQIPRSRRPSDKLAKGYYYTEADLVRRIKEAVAGVREWKPREFRTVECSVMDVADDIAYSTFDLEDSLKAGFLTPSSILSSSEKLLQAVADKVKKELGYTFSARDVLRVFAEIFAPDEDGDIDDLSDFGEVYRMHRNIAASGYLRTKLSSELVKKAINSADVDFNSAHPMLSTVRLSKESRERVEVLKQYTYVATIYSSRVSLPEYRGYEVVKGIFTALAGERGFLLMPQDVRDQHEAAKGDMDTQMRVVCDFVAGMTDRYAMEFYGRLHSDSAQSMFKPV